MFVLLTTLFILASRKIVCQVQVSQEVAYLPSPFLPGRTTHSGSAHWTASTQTFQLSQKPENSIIINKTNSSAATRQTTKNQQKSKLFTSRFQSRGMDQRRFGNTNSSSAQNSNSTQISSNSTGDIYDKVVFEDEGDVLMGTNSVKSGSQAARNGTSDNSRPPDSVSTVPPPGNVTVVDRGAFDGDACPTGYVRVNGVCVMPD